DTSGTAEDDAPVRPLAGAPCTHDNGRSGRAALERPTPCRCPRSPVVSQRALPRIPPSVLGNEVVVVPVESRSKAREGGNATTSLMNPIGPFVPPRAGVLFSENVDDSPTAWYPTAAPSASAVAARAVRCARHWY